MISYCPFFKVLRISAIFFSVIYTSSAFAVRSCIGTVKQLVISEWHGAPMNTTSNVGLIAVVEIDGTDRAFRICGLQEGNTQDPIKSELCKVLHTTFATAQATGSKVKMNWDSNDSCADIGDWRPGEKLKELRILNN